MPFKWAGLSEQASKEWHDESLMINPSRVSFLLNIDPEAQL